MSIDKYVAERRRFARLLGTADSPGSGLPVGPSTAADAVGETVADGGDGDESGVDGTAARDAGESTSESTSESGGQPTLRREPEHADERRSRADGTAVNERDDRN